VPVEASLVEDDHVVEALAANRADHPLHVRTLLRHSWRSQPLNAQLFHLLGEIRTEDAIPVSQ
jgi:hypothetical protein